MRRQNFQSTTTGSARPRVPRAPLPFNLPSKRREAGVNLASGGIAATGAKWATPRSAESDDARRHSKPDEPCAPPKTAWGGAGLRPSRPASDFPNLAKPVTSTFTHELDDSIKVSSDPPPQTSSQSISKPLSSKSDLSSDSISSNAPIRDGPSKPSVTEDHSSPSSSTSGSTCPKEQPATVFGAAAAFANEDDDDDDWADDSQAMDFLSDPVPLSDIMIHEPRLEPSPDPPEPAVTTPTSTPNPSRVMFPSPPRQNQQLRPRQPQFPPPAAHWAVPPRDPGSQIRTSNVPVSNPPRPSPMFPDDRPTRESPYNHDFSDIDLKAIEEQTAIMKSKAEQAKEARRREEEERERIQKEKAARKLRELEERLRLKKEQEAGIVSTSATAPVPESSQLQQMINGKTINDSHGIHQPAGASNFASVSPRVVLHRPKLDAAHSHDSMPLLRREKGLRSPRVAPAYQRYRNGSHGAAVEGRPRRPHVIPARDYDGPADNETRDQWLERRRRQTETRNAVRSIIDIVITRAVNGGHAAPKRMHHRRPPGAAMPHRRDHPRRDGRGVPPAMRPPPNREGSSVERARFGPPLRRDGAHRRAPSGLFDSSMRSPPHLEKPRPDLSSRNEPPQSTGDTLLRHSSPPDRPTRSAPWNGVSLSANPSTLVLTNDRTTTREPLLQPAKLPTKSDSPLYCETPKHDELSSHDVSTSPLQSLSDAPARKKMAPPPMRPAPWADKSLLHPSRSMGMSPMAALRAQEEAEAAQRSQVPRKDVSSVSSIFPPQNADASSQDAYVSNSQSEVPPPPVSSKLTKTSNSPISNKNVAGVGRGDHSVSVGGRSDSDVLSHNGSRTQSVHDKMKSLTIPPTLGGNVKVLMNPNARRDAPRVMSISGGRDGGSGLNSGRGGARVVHNEASRGRGMPPKRRGGKSDYPMRDRRELKGKEDTFSPSDSNDNDSDMDNCSRETFGPSLASLPIVRDEKEESWAWAKASNGPAPNPSFDAIKRAFSNQPAPFALVGAPLFPPVPFVSEITSSTDAKTSGPFESKHNAWSSNKSWSERMSDDKNGSEWWKSSLESKEASVDKPDDTMSRSAGVRASTKDPSDKKQGSDSHVQGSAEDRSPHARRHRSSGENSSRDAMNSRGRGRRALRSNRRVRRGHSERGGSGDNEGQTSLNEKIGFDTSLRASSIKEDNRKGETKAGRPASTLLSHVKASDLETVATTLERAEEFDTESDDVAPVKANGNGIGQSISSGSIEGRAGSEAGGIRNVGAPSRGRGRRGPGRSRRKDGGRELQERRAGLKSRVEDAKDEWTESSASNNGQKVDQSSSGTRSRHLTNRNHGAVRTNGGVMINESRAAVQDTPSSKSVRVEFSSSRGINRGARGGRDRNLSSIRPPPGGGRENRDEFLTESTGNDSSTIRADADRSSVVDNTDFDERDMTLGSESGRGRGRTRSTRRRGGRYRGRFGRGRGRGGGPQQAHDMGDSNVNVNDAKLSATS